MNKKFHIVADENMPGVETLFGEIASIKKIAGRVIDSSDLKNADALLCRSITQVDQNLLQNSSVKFVGTATIGVDHLDIDWLNANHIDWANAAGCNAAAVAQYVLSGISYWCLRFGHSIQQLTIGIVGAGNVGTELSRCLEALNIKYKLCDPPLADNGDPRRMVSLNEILECDVVSLHVPIETRGKYPTEHLINAQIFKRLSSQQLLINASRGAVIDNLELIQCLQASDSAQVILDVFENEPNVPRELIQGCLLSTPHIAGHTLEGKLRGTWMVYQAFCETFDIEQTQQERNLYPKDNEIAFQIDRLEEQLLEVYPIQMDANALSAVSTKELAEKFDILRKNATQLGNGQIRRDYAGWRCLSNSLLAASLLAPLD